jgi:hypothetical protein
MTFSAITVLALLLAPGAENPIMLQLTQQGLPTDLEGKTLVKIASPSMLDGLDAAAQRRVLEQVAGPNRRVEDLLHNAVVAPFVLKIDDVSAPAGAEPLRRVDVWYVAYGKLEQFFEEEFYENLVEVAQGEKKSRLPTAKGTLKDDDLKRRGLEVKATDDLKEQYSYGTFPLFDRVLVSSTRHIVVTKQPESVVVAAVIDPRFTQDAKHPNQWRSASVDPQGKVTIGSPKPYVTSGSYTKITRLKEPAGALFIEHRQLFAEPEGWFGGKNLLRSKLPLAVQDTVRKLRRQLRGAAALEN